MKLNDETRFPHPVLSPQTGDYLNGVFEFTVSVEETIKPSQVTLHCKLELTEPTLRELIVSGDAAVGLFVTCLDSYLAKPVTVGLEGGTLSFEPGELIGKVTLRPMIWSRRMISNYSLANCHEEFGGGSIELASGTILALDDPMTINVGREKLAQMDTIFAIAEAEQLDLGELSVSLDSDRIKILAAKDVYQQLNTLRGQGAGSKVILNSVYMPAVMQVLNTLRDGANGYEGLRWYKVFTAKCEHLNIDFANPDLWKSAQRLLEMPFTEITKSPEIMGT